jgi:hypothetical protein
MGNLPPLRNLSYFRHTLANPVTSAGECILCFSSLKVPRNPAWCFIHFDTLAIVATNLEDPLIMQIKKTYPFTGVK